MSSGDKKRSKGIPEPSSEAARNRMRAARQRDTKPEIQLRAALDSQDIVYEVDVSPIAGVRRRADILFREVQVAVFVDGCFWHGCPIHGTWPKQNAEFWRDKIETNRRRDADTDQRLLEAGWFVVRAWEHENMNEVAQKIASIVASRPGTMDAI